MKRQSGFTLLELMVALAIAAVLASVAVPNMIAYRSNQRLSAAARQILGVMQETRMLAIKEGREIVVRFDIATQSYLIFADTGEEDADGNKILDEDKNIVGAGNGILDEGEDIISEETLPSDIRMTEATFARGVPRTRFDFRGMATQFGGHVSLANARGSALRVTLRASGSAVIKKDI